MGLFGLFGKKKETPKAPPLSEEEIKRREPEAGSRSAGG